MSDALAKKTVVTGVVPPPDRTGLELLHHLEASTFNFAPEPGRTFFDPVSRQVVTMNETELIRYGRQGAKTALQIQNRGKPIMNVVFSPNSDFICIQRGPNEIEFTNVHAKRTFNKTFRHPKPSSVLGLHWTSNNTILVVTTQTWELYQAEAGGQLKLIKDHALAMTWYKYSARNKVLVAVSSGPGNNGKDAVTSLHAFCFKGDSYVRVPRFDLLRVVREEQLQICQVYATVYLMLLDDAAGALRLYSLTKERIAGPEHNLKLVSSGGGGRAQSGSFRVNVVDNMIAVHNLEGKVTLLFDMQGPDPEFPIAGPLGIRGGEHLYTKDCLLLMPHMLMDEQHGRFYALELRLGDVLKSHNPDPNLLLRFLVRRAKSKQLIVEHLRRLLLTAAPLHILRGAFDLLNSIVASLLPVVVIAATPPTRRAGEAAGGVAKGPRQSATLPGKSTISAPAVLASTGASSAAPLSSSGKSAAAAAAAAAAKAGWTVEEMEDVETLLEDTDVSEQRTPSGLMVIDQRSIYADVFSLVLEEEGRDKYLVAVLTEYIRLLVAYRIPVEHFVFEMVIGLLVKNGWYCQLQMLLQYHVVDDSMPVAFQLMSISSAKCPAAHQLALDMLRRLKKFDVIVDVLLAHDEVLSALKIVADHSLRNVDPKRFLDASINTPSLYFTVFRFFESCGYSAASHYVQRFSKEFGVGSERAPPASPLPAPALATQDEDGPPLRK